MKQKYNFQYENTCVLFYRGNDKSTEMELPKYESYLENGRELEKQNPNIHFFIQSDEAEFIDEMKNKFPNSTVFLDEIRYIKRSNNTVDQVYRNLNPISSKYFLAIMYMMSKCKYVICGKGNCSFWITMFRRNYDNVIQL